MASTHISLPVTNVGSVAVGTVDVNVSSIENISGTVSIAGQNELNYNEIYNLQSGATETILSMYFSSAYKLRRVATTGDNVAVYTVYFNDNAIDKKRSNITDYNCEFDYETGITIPANTTVNIVVKNASENSGEFSATLLYSAQ